MKKVLFTLMILLVLISGCTNKEEDKLENSATDALKFKEEYESLNGKEKSSGNGKYTSIELSENNAIVYSSVGEILSVLESGTGVIYFGFPECPWCRSAISTLLNTADMTGIPKIYYFNARSIRDEKHLDENGEIVVDKEGTDEYYDLVKALDSVLPAYDGLNDETIKRLYFPTVVFVKDGTILGMHEGTVDSQEDPNILLTKEQEAELADIYSTYMHDVLGDVCDKSC